MQIVRKAKFQASKSCRAAFPGEEGTAGRGLAVDIGTTTVAVTMYDLKNGEILGNTREKNRQTEMGADVMMRLMHCRRGQQQRLQQMIQKQIESMTETLLSQGGYAPGTVKKMVVVGNTTMCHIFLGKDTEGLSGSPFEPAYRGSYSCLGKEIGLELLSEIEIYVPAGIDAHVGADAVSMATFLAGDNTDIRLAVDIGTNAEIVLWNRDQIAACSAPAGPAFEGAQIFQGMRGEPGAISSFKIASGSQNILLEVIGNPKNEKGVSETPRGICGSGLIDCIAQLRAVNLVTAQGYLLSREEAKDSGYPNFLTERLEEEAFVVYISPEGENILLKREDIRQFQLAKASVQAGIRLLLASQNLTLSQVDKIYIAGVFGGAISEKNAVATGLFPKVAQGVLEFAGNAAGQGAAQALFSSDFRQKTLELSQKAKHLELADREEFQQEFLTSMNLEPWGI